MQTNLLQSAAKVDKVSGFFYISILVSAIGAFVFGFSLGFTSPTFLASYEGLPKDGPTECVLVNPSKGDKKKPCVAVYVANEIMPGCYLDDVQCADPANKGTWVNVTGAPFTKTGGFCAGPEAKGKMNCDLKMSQELTSWFGSLINIGALVGALTGGPIADAVGKKIGMVISYLFYVLGWVLICFVPKTPAMVDEDTVSLMLVGSRIAIGFAIGITCCTVSNFQTESCPTVMRGAVGTLFQVAIVLGLMLAYLIGTVLDNWLSLAYIMLALSVAGLVLTPIVLGETPIYLLLKNKRTEAQAALARLRTADSDISGLLEQMSQDSGGDGDASKGGFGVLLGGGAPTKALLIGIGLMFVQQLSGINAVMFYCGTILQSVFDPATANKVAVGIQVMQLFITIFSVPVMDKAGRVPILLFAACGQCICAMVLGAYYLSIKCTSDNGIDHHSQSGGDLLADYSSTDFTLADTFYTAEMIATGAEPICKSALPKMVAAVALYGYVGFFSCGMGAIPWFLMGEIFPAEVKGLASSVATAINWSLAFFITKTVGTLTELLGGTANNVGLGGVFVAYGTVCALGAIFVKAVIPETKGKSFAQIQQELGGESTSSKPRNSTQERSYQW